MFKEIIIDVKSLIKKRRHQFFFNILSLSYQSIGDYQSSIDIMSDALKLNSRNIAFLNNMGTTFHKMDKFHESEKQFLKALEINPNYINALNNLANLKKDLNCIDEAVNLYKKCLTTNNNLLDVHFNLAGIYQSLGDYDLCKTHLQKILELNPGFTQADRMIAHITKHKKDAPHFKKMLKKIENPKFNDHQLLELYFGLGKSFEDIKDYKNSFFNYKKGNDIKKKLTNYNIEKDINFFSNIKNSFKNFQDINTNINNKKIIFILGMPRSGTSLVEQILSSHQNVYGAGELNFISKITKKYFLNENLDIIDLKKNIPTAQNEYLKLISHFDKTSSAFTDKAPENFKYIGFIKMFLPNSKIINCKRNTMDVCWSNYKSYFSAGLNFSNNLSDLANYYNEYEDMMKFWNQNFPDQVYELNYENLVNDSENQIKKLLKFCDLQFDPSCLNHEKNKRLIKTVSFNQARKPIYKTAIKSSENFKEYLSELTSGLKY
jgi:tetratricopeptide (TPR) repeat protein